MHVTWQELIVEAKRRQPKDETVEHNFHVLFMWTIEKISFTCKILNGYFAVLVKKLGSKCLLGKSPRWNCILI